MAAPALCSDFKLHLQSLTNKLYITLKMIHLSNCFSKYQFLNDVHMPLSYEIYYFKKCIITQNGGTLLKNQLLRKHLVSITFLIYIYIYKDLNAV